MSDCPHIERTHAFADGELAGADADAAREHLVDCDVCQAELAELMQLDAAVVAQLPPAVKVDRSPAIGGVAPVISLAWYRRRKVQVAATVALAAAASVAVYAALPKHAATSGTSGQHDRASTVALAEHRALESRLSWRGADAYRAYDVPRAAEAPHENVPLSALADVEKAGDSHGVGALALLNGDRRQAQTYLEKAGDSPDVVSDRAALALAEHHPERALALADAALAAAPNHAAATWNRALALRDLGLNRAAAAAFRAVAARSEPGWAAEATARATQLDAELDAQRDRVNRVLAGGQQLVQGGTGIAVEDARAEVGMARIWLYDALRAAPSAARIDALAPLVAAVDAADHTTDLAAFAARAKANLHPALSERYGALVLAIAANDASKIPTGADRAKLLADLRAARANDLLIGALVKLAPDHRTVAPDELPELAKLAAASPDAWMQLLGREQRAIAAIHAADFAGAEALLLPGRETCAKGGPRYRCARIDERLVDIYLQTQRLPEARAVLDAAWARTRADGAWFESLVLLPQLSQLAVFTDDIGGTGLPLARAYVQEEDLRRSAYDPHGGTCTRTAWGRGQLALAFANQFRFAEARAEIAAPVCDQPTLDMTASDLFVRAQLARDGGNADEVKQVRADLAALREAPGVQPRQLAIADNAEGRLTIDAERATGTAYLLRAIEAASRSPGDATARKTAAYSYAVLVLDAAKRNEGASALQLLAEEQHLPAPTACALGLAVDGKRRAAIATGPNGALAIHYDEARTTPAVDPQTFVPAEVAAALRGCPAVDVIARPPLDGAPRILPDDVAWRYRVSRPRPALPASPTAPSIVVANVAPPPALDLPALATWSPGGELISGSAATPARVLAAIGTAGDAVIHAHGLVDLASPDASFLALSPDASGKYALTTGDVRAATFAASPLVILAACRASQAAPVFHEAWSLPAAFVHAGARGVIASAAPIPDADAGAFFDDVRARVRGGAVIAVALRDARVAWLSAHPGATWVRDVMVFE